MVWIFSKREKNNQKKYIYRA